jgi:hypothetical protein
LPGNFSFTSVFVQVPRVESAPLIFCSDCQLKSRPGFWILTHKETAGNRPELIATRPENHHAPLSPLSAEVITCRFSALFFQGFGRNCRRYA